MSAFADTSFLFAFYFPRDASARAVEVVQSATEPLLITGLVDFEFRQAVWFEVFWRRNGQPRGLSEVQPELRSRNGQTEAARAGSAAFMPQQAGKEKCVRSTAGGRTFLRPEGRAPGRGLPRYFGIRVQAQTGLAAFELDCEQGVWTKVALPLETLLASARELSFKHTARTGCRAFDLLHVASALTSEARTFLNFDLTQCQLAQSEGLTVPLVEPGGIQTA